MLGGYVLAFSADPEQLDRIAFDIGSRGWLRIAQCGSAAIFSEPGVRALRSGGDDGVHLFGTIFERHGPPRPVERISATAARGFQTGDYRQLLQGYWGDYVAISLAASGCTVLREPSAATSCLVSRRTGAVIVGSSVAALRIAGLPRPTVTYDHLAHWLYRANLPTEDTAIDGLRELLPGNVLHIDSDRLLIEPVWSPFEHVASNAELGFDQQAEHLRRMIENVTTAWRDPRGAALIGVSGGLDSSIVAGCLARAGGSATCVTVATDDPDGDERPFARQLCQRLRLRLREMRYDMADMSLSRSASDGLPRPISRSSALAYNAAIERAATDVGATAFFTGNGGDNVFAYSQSAAAIADRLLVEGWFGGTWRTLGDVCRLTGCSVFQAGSAALRLYKGPHRYRWRPNRCFLSRALTREFDQADLKHPWLDAPEATVPGKAAHIAALLRIQPHLSATLWLSGVKVINPLMSQPIIETCLGIPSWLWCDRGRNRSVAREAFKDMLPPCLTNRVSKGGPDGFGAEFLARRREDVAERLLHGALARNGIIDGPAIERALSDEDLKRPAEQTRLLELVDAEAWIDQWSSG